MTTADRNTEYSAQQYIADAELSVALYDANLASVLAVSQETPVVRTPSTPPTVPSPSGSAYFSPLVTASISLPGFEFVDVWRQAYDEGQDNYT